MSIDNKLIYLNETKDKIKKAISVPIKDTDTFRSYPDKIKQMKDREEKLLVLGGIDSASGEDSLRLENGIEYIGDILKETEIEESGEKRQGYEVTLPQGLSRQEQREGYNQLDLENEGKELSLKYTAEYNLKYENCKEQQTLKAGTYTLALKVKSLANGSINAVSLKNVDTTVATFSGYTTTTTAEKLFIKTITVDTDVTFNRISIQNAQVGTYIIKEIMILKGTYTEETLPAYEQYGSTPSIELESPIENVKAWNSINNVAQSTSNNGINFTVNEDKSITLNGTATSQAYICLTNTNNNINNYTNKILTLKNKYYIDSLESNRISYGFRDTSGNYKSLATLIGKDIGLIYINVEQGASFNNYTIYPMLINGSSKHKPYAPYGAINTGLENKNLISDNINDWDEGHYNASTGFPEPYRSRIRLIQLVKVKPNTTYYCNTYNNLYGFVIREYDYNKNFINITSGVSNDTITTNLNTEYLSIALYKTNAPETTSEELFNLVENGTIKPFICLNNESNKDYVVHQEQNYNLHLGDLELNGIGEIRDSFVIELDNNYSYKKVKKLYLNKKFEKFNILSSFPLSLVDNNTKISFSSNGVSSFNPKISLPESASSVVKGYCNYLKIKPQLALSSSSGFAISQWTNVKYGYFSVIDFPTVENLQQFLDEHNVYVTYEIEPQLIDLTEDYPQLVEDIENLINNISTYNNITYINTPTGYLEISYITKENDKYLELEEKANYQNNKNTLLEKNQIIKTAAGEDSLTINDSAEMFTEILKETEIEVEGEKKKAYLVGLPQGRSRQEQRKGYNLYNINDMQTFTNATIEENDFIKASGDNSEGTNPIYSNIFNKKSNELLTNTQYYVITEIKEITGMGTFFPVTSGFPQSQFSEQKSYALTKLKAGDILIDKFTTLSDFTGKTGMLRTIVKYDIGQSGNITFRLSVIPVSYGTITEETFVYEQYGATPSIEIPSEIENVKAYNLIDFSNPINKTPNTTYSFENDILKVVTTSGTYTSISWNMLDFFKKNPGKKIYFKYKSVNFSQANNPFVQIATIINGVTNYNALWKTNKETSYTIPDDVSQLTQATFLVYPNNTSTDIEATIIFTEPMLVLEKDINKPYAPYETISIGLENKNLAEVEFGGYSQTTGEKITDNSLYRSIKPIKIENNNYFLSQHNNINIPIRVFLYDEYMNFINSSTTNSLIIINNAQARYFNWQGQAASFSSTMEGILLEEGDTATSYIEHQEQNYNLHINDLELNGIGDIRDSFVVEIDNSYSYKKVKKLYLKKLYKKVNDFTGASKQNTLDGTTSRLYKRLGTNYLKCDTETSAKAMSNILKLVGNGQTYSKIEGFTVGPIPGNENMFLWMYINGYDNLSAEEYIAKLNEIGAYFVLPLKTPQLLDLTETYPELVQDIENIINNMYTYEEVTHIDTSIGYLEINYNQSINSLINEYENRISALENAVLGE